MAHITCACCGRQIVDYQTDDEYTIGPYRGSMNLGFGKYACPPCTNDEIEWERIMEGDDHKCSANR